MVELAGTQPGRMQRDRHEQITIDLRGDGPNHQRSEGFRQREFPAILEGADRILERGKIGEERPGLLVGRGPFKAILALVIRCPGCGRR